MGILNLLPKRFTTNIHSGIEDHHDVTSMPYEESPKGKDPFMGIRPIKGNHVRPSAITEVLAGTAPSPHVPHGPRSNLEQQIIYKEGAPVNRETASASRDSSLETPDDSNPSAQLHTQPLTPLRHKKSDPLLQRPNGHTRQPGLRRSSSELNINGYAQARRQSNNPTTQISRTGIYEEDVADRNMDPRSKRIYHKPVPPKITSRYSNAHLFYPQLAELNLENGDWSASTPQRARSRGKERDQKTKKLPPGFRDGVNDLPLHGDIPIRDKSEQPRKARRVIVLRNRKDPATLDRGNMLPRKYIDCSPVSSSYHGRKSDSQDSSEPSSSLDSPEESLFDMPLSEFPLPPSHRPMSHQFPIPSPSPNPMNSIISQPQRFSSVVQRPSVRGVMDGNDDKAFRDAHLLKPNAVMAETRHSLSSSNSLKPTTSSDADRLASVATVATQNTTIPAVDNFPREEISCDIRTHYNYYRIQPVVNKNVLPSRHIPQEINGTLHEITPKNIPNYRHNPHHPRRQQRTIEKVSQTTDDPHPPPTSRAPEIVLQRALTPSPPPNTAARQRAQASTVEDTECVPRSRALTSAKAHRRLEIPPAHVPRRRSSIREQAVDLSRYAPGRRTTLAQVNEGGEGRR
ncbi:MAG: hypothetical protein M1829_003577 [Trizodia sp. TS-e1964]|nr:MAG: hypothetical protein M1829_003577 [Trizodia sp. TS-e1964]